MRKRFLAHPDELQTSMKKIKTSVSRNSPSISLRSILSFVFVSSLDEFDQYVSDPKYNGHSAIKPEIWPSDKSGEQDLDDLIYGYEHLNLTVFCETRGLAFYISISAKAVSEVSITTEQLLDRILKRLPVVDRSAITNPSIFRKALKDRSLRDQISISDQDSLIAIFSGADKSTCSFNDEFLTLPKDVCARIKSAFWTFQFLYQFYTDSGSCIESESERLEFALYFKGQSVAGLLSYCKFFTNYQDYKVQIAQLFVLSAHRKQGIGARLLRHIYTTYQSQQQCKLITVKDPTSSFARLQLLTLSQFSLSPPIRKDTDQIFSFLDTHDLSEVLKLSLEKVEDRFAASLKIRPPIIAKLIDVLMYSYMKVKGRRPEFLFYLRSKIRHRVEKESVQRVSKASRKFLMFQGVQVSSLAIKETLECYYEAESPDISSIFHEQIEEIEDVLKSLSLELN